MPTTIRPQPADDAAAVRVRDVSLSAHDAPRTRHQKLARIVLDEMVHFAGLLDPDGMVLEFNRAALEGTGMRLDEIRGTPFWEGRWWAVTNESREFHRELIRRAAQGEFVRCDAEIYGRDGGAQTITIDYSLLPVKDHEGRVVFLLPEGRDITEKKRVETESARKNEELRQLLEQRQQLDQLKSDFFANISHELRTPLALILGPAESILANGDNLTEQQQRDLRVIHRNAATLLKHVNDLLDLAKFDAGKLTLAYARVDVASRVRAVARHFDGLAPRRSLSCVIVAPASLQADVDPEKFDRVLLNLLSNAFKFTPAGGRIRCVLEAAGSAGLRLSVQDSGPGVRPDMREAIFERFRQAQGGTTREFSGSGLGLAIAKDFVELHGGTIQTWNAADGGAVFQVALPLAAPPGVYVRDVGVSLPPVDSSVVSALGIEERPMTQRNAVASDGRPDMPRVLVAEDNAEMRRFISDVLAGECVVITAADGQEALERAIAEPPDLIVTDLMMPRLGGDALVTELRQRPALAQVPVLVLSAKADEELRVKLLAESVQDYVTKPFSPHELRARVHNLLMMKRARDALQTELASQDQDLSQLTQQIIANRQALQRSVEALRDSEHRWRAVYENSAAGIALTDLGGRVLSANPAFCSLLGYTEAQLREMSLAQLTPEDERDVVRARLARVVAGEVDEYRVQRRYRRSDGSFVWANVSVSIIPGTERMEPMLMRIVQDISERRLAEEALATVRNELARVTRVTAMGELAASIAHDVNQPLAAIVANGHACTRWLGADPPNQGEAHAAIQRIIRDANRASDVIARIRGFLKRGEPQQTPLRIDELIDEVAGLVNDAARSQHVALQQGAAADLPAVFADRVQLQQVLLNLAMNAIEAMASVQGRPRTLKLFAEQHGPDAVGVSVRDSGVGLEAGQRERIFDAFYTTKPQGLGMGLAICRGIVEAGGGRLWVTPNDGPGETFRFTLPIAAPHS